MQTDLTEIVVLLDKSQSMSVMREPAIVAFNKFVEEQKKVPGRARLSLIQFDDEYTPTYEGKDIRDVEPLTDKTYVPRGSTAFNGALGQTIDRLGERLAATPEYLRPGKVIVVVITDGEENWSDKVEWGKKYTRDVVRAKVEHQEAAYNWTFAFLSANLDAQKTATSYGISAANSINFAANAKSLTRAVGKMSSGMACYRMSGEHLAARSFFGGSADADDDIEVAVPVAVK